MHILRNGKEIAASALGLEPGAVFPSTELDGKGHEVLTALLVAVEGGLADDGAITLPPAAVNGDLAARLRRVGLAAPEPPRPSTVAEAAEIATRHAVRLLVANRLDVPAEELTPELSFGVDLGADSLTRVDLVLLLEEALEVSVPDDSMSLVQTVGDSELFAVLYDLTREGLIAVYGAPAEKLAYNTPLSTLGGDGPATALAAASRAAGFELPERPPRTLQDAVRLAFLARRVRSALAAAAGADPTALSAETMPERDLGLSPAETTEALRRLAGAMDLALPREVGPEQLRTIAAAVAALTAPCAAGDGGAPR